MGRTDRNDRRKSMLGTVEWFNDIRGFGILDAEQCDREVYVHFSDIETGGFQTLRCGETVEFELDRTGDRLEAKNVRRAESGHSAPAPPEERT